MKLKIALAWSAFWITLSLAFCAGVWWYMGLDVALTWLSCYTVEKLLSFDNLLMFYAIFKFFGTSEKDQSRALNWGVFGAMLLRGIIIFGGASLIAVAPWLLYICGAFLAFTGLKMLFSNGGDEDATPEKTVNKIKKWLPALSLLALTIVTIELTDVLFALDSIPAAFGITTDAFILYTSNIAAILGLRSLYFVMTALIEKFHFLEKGVAIILTGIGAKMLIKDLVTISNPVTFAFILGTLGLAILLSAMKEYAAKPETPKNKGVMRSVCTFFFKPPTPPTTTINDKESKPCVSSRV